MRHVGIAVAIVLAITSRRPAAAEPSAADRAEATRLFEQGRTLLKDEKYAEACDAFAKSFALDQAPGTQVNLGDCALREGHVAKAWRLYDAAAHEYERTSRSAGAKFARDAATALAPRLATVAIRVADPKTDGLELHVAELDVPASDNIVVLVDPGKLEVTARAPGRAPFAITIEGIAGKRVSVKIPALDETASTPPIDKPATREGARDPGRVKLAIGVGVAGGALLATSLVLGLLARQDYNDVLGDPNGCFETPTGLLCKTPDAAQRVSDATDKANLATGIAIAGAVVTAGAVILFVTAPREHVAVVPTATASSVGIGLIGRF